MADSKTFLATGGAGFIGSAVARELIDNSPHLVVNVHKLTCTGNLESLASVPDKERYHFIQTDISDSEHIRQSFAEDQPDVVKHLAAGSHLCRSIHGPETSCARTSWGSTLDLAPYSLSTKSPSLDITHL